MLLNGVRKAAIATARGGGGTGMERTMAVSLRESVHLVSDPRNLDASVEEVFQLMLGVNCRRELRTVSSQELESVTAVVGFGGLLSGACVFTSRPNGCHEDGRAYDRHGVSRDRRHREGRDRRDMQHAGRGVEGQGSGTGRQLRTLGSGRHYRPGLQAPRPGPRVPIAPLSTASRNRALQSRSSATACNKLPLHSGRATDWDCTSL